MAMPHNDTPDIQDRLQQFWENNQRMIVGVLGGLVLIIVAFFGYNQFVKKPKLKKAQEKIFPAQIYLKQDSARLALNGDQLNLGFMDHAKKYKGTPQGNYSAAAAGFLLMKEGDYDNAIKHLKKCKSKDEFVRAYCLLNLGHAYSEKGEFDKALSYYKDAADHSENDITTPLSLMYAGRVAERLENYGQAVELFEQIRNRYPNSPEARDAPKFIARLKTMEG